MNQTVNIYEILGVPDVIDTIMLHLTDTDTRSLLAATGFSLQGPRSYWYMTPIRYAFPNLKCFLKMATNGYDFLVSWQRHDILAESPDQSDYACITLVAFVSKDEYYVDCHRGNMPVSAFENADTDVRVVKDFSFTTYEPVCRYVEMRTPRGHVRLKLPLVRGATSVPMYIDGSVLIDTVVSPVPAPSNYIFTGSLEANFVDAPESAYADQWYILTFKKATNAEHPHVHRLH